MSPISEILESLAYGAGTTALRGLAALPTRVQQFGAGGPIRCDGLELAPEIALSLRLLGLVPGESFECMDPPDAREVIRREARLFSGLRTPGVEAEDVAIPRPGGEIRARLYVPSAPPGPPIPLVVYYHGGGWVVGDLETHDPVCRFLAHETGFAVLAVDYRLAPEHPFPAALEDAVTAFRWAAQAAATIDVDPTRIAVAGDSAGGNLAACVAQETVAAGGPAPALQVLVYPVTDLSTKRRSYRLFSEGYFLTEAQMDWYRHHYIGEADGTDPRCSPILAPDLSGLPPAYVTTAGFDVLRDEGEEYAARLDKAGVPTALRRHSGLVHGWVNAVGLGRTPRSAGDELAAAIRDALLGLRG